MCIRGLFLTSAINDQSASAFVHLRTCAAVNAYGLDANVLEAFGHPTMYLLLSSQPSRVLTVTGKVHVSTISLVMATIFGMSFKMPAPAPRQATFFTGQP